MKRILGLDLGTTSIGWTKHKYLEKKASPKRGIAHETRV